LLTLYISDLKRYALPFQVIILKDRIALLKKAFEIDSEEKIILLDRGLIGDACFALMQYENGYFTDQEYKVYKSLTNIDHLDGAVRTIYLRCDPKVSFDRMKKRGAEQYTLEYLIDLHEMHEELLEGNETIDWNEDRESIPDDLCSKILFGV
jgi:deoxyadenosine/deoxycytidine kinase